MLAQVEFVPKDKVLDLGCGWGLAGVLAARVIAPARVWLVEKDPRAVACAAANLMRNGAAGAHCLASDGFAGLDESGFSKILCNPPFHTDFSVAKGFIEKGFNRLAIGGELWLVTRRERWYVRKLAQIFGGARLRRSDGYRVFCAQRRSRRWAKAESRASS